MSRNARSGAILPAFGALILGVLLTLPLSAQTNGGPTGGSVPPGDGALGIEVPDVTVAPGELFTLTVALDDPNPIDNMVVFIDTNPSNVQFLSWVPGAGLQNYLNTNGTPPQCDVFVDPMSFTGFMFFAPPYESSVYGTSLYEITCAANGPVGTYSINWFVDGMGNFAQGVTTITIGEPSPGMMRGDVNDDGACNITDAVNLLGHLFAGSFDPNCPDAADIDDDGTVNITDAVNLLSALFVGTFDLDDSCQPDATEDGLEPCGRASCQ